MTLINKAIFGYPRSATKLLASVYEAHGYHNFGEFFNSYSSDIVTNSNPYAVRMTYRKQQEMLATGYNDSLHGLITKERITKFKNYAHISPSIVTIWIATFTMAPEIIDVIGDRFILCTRRDNRFDQLISRCITKIHLNHNNECTSLPIIVDLNFFDSCIKMLCQVEQLQDYLVTQGKGCLINFDHLIAGTQELGFNYLVTSDDQHTNLEDLILNYEEVRARYDFHLSRLPKSWY